jgi:hypothetical protein
MNRETLDCSEKFAEAWLSCMVMMAQGNFLAMTVPHTIVALKVATSSVLAYAAIQMAFKRENPFLNILIMSLVTALMDFNFVPTHFGPVWAEAVATGAGTAVLGLIVKFLRKK